MSPTDETVHTGGIYDVTESGIKYRHIPPAPPTPRDGTEFLARFKKNFKMRIIEHPHPNHLVFEMLNIDVSLANALRRIMIAEIPTVAIEHVYMWNNTSIIHDEVLSHRLGLVPINADPRLFDEFVGDDDEATDRNTVVFRLSVKCEKKSSKSSSSRKSNRRGDDEDDDNNAGRTTITHDADADDAARDTSLNTHLSSRNIRSAMDAVPGRPYTHHVYSSDLQWMPQGDQATRFPPPGLRPMHEDILLAKLRPGQVMELEAHGRIGVGKDHAKYSPVATACYRLMPVVELVKDVYDDKAELLDLYEPGVFKMVDCSEEEKRRGYQKKAAVHNPYACTMSRNFMRDEVLKESVKITRKENHFIFSVESVGMIPSSVILAESLKVLKAKCHNVIRMVDETLEGHDLES